MMFKKSGKELRESVESRIAQLREETQDAMARFEREKEKAALQRTAELELTIKRLERILRHVTAEQSYELTEQDLEDFGFE